MNFVVCSRFNRDTIAGAIGEPEYSYYFVLKEFLPLLRSIGTVHVVDTPEDADVLCVRLGEEGKVNVFLQFTAPHNVARDVRCPVIPVFAWEFDTIPTDTWNGDGYNNWRLALAKSRGAITHSHGTVTAVKQVLGEDYPVVAIPAPVWDRCADTRRLVLGLTTEQRLQGGVLDFFGVVCDSRDVDFGTVLKATFGDPTQSQFGEQVEEEPENQTMPRRSLRFRLGTAKMLLIQIYHECFADLVPGFIERALAVLVNGLRPLYRKVLPKAPIHAETASEPSDTDRKNMVELTGVVYTSLFNPYDGRKNWETMLTAFCWAFRDTEDATLLIKVSTNNVVFFTDQVVDYLRRLPPFKCRVVVIKAFLENEHYQRMLEASSYYVNTSYGEGQCLPLMEFLASGVPALAPVNSAMKDYMSKDVGFVIDSRPELASWQHDERRLLRTFHHRVDWQSTVDAFTHSYELMKNDPQRYRAMSLAAAERMRQHCSIEVLSERLKSFLAGDTEECLTENMHPLDMKSTAGLAE
ncbi:glycosyltransferase [Gilvimarinus sp. F26214L]|uniref:glycosyltransferase n=1 Tax=Gilvimarinus sp. DZF01 TaxID=3461371 RepID=UPI0040461350